MVHAQRVVRGARASCLHTQQPANTPSAILFSMTFLWLVSALIYSPGVFSDETLSADWNETYKGPLGATYIKQCNESNPGDCPSIRVLFRKTEQNFNRAYIDRVITDYVDRLEKLGHEQIVYEIEDVNAVTSVRVTSAKTGVNYNTIIAVSNSQIRYFEYSAMAKYYPDFEKDFDQFWKSELSHAGG